MHIILKDDKGYIIHIACPRPKLNVFWSTALPFQNEPTGLQPASLCGMMLRGFLLS